MIESNAGANCEMVLQTAPFSAMDLHEIRLKNLRFLIERVGSQAKLAALLDIEPSFISQINTGARGMGERFARDLETAFNLPRGAMDRPDLEAGVSRDLAALESIISEAYDAARAAGWAESGTKFARLCVAAYRIYLETGAAPNTALALRLRDLLDEAD